MSISSAASLTAESRSDNHFRRRYKGDDGAIVIGIDMRVEHTGSWHRGDRLGQSRNRFGLAAFAEVWYTLHQRIADCGLLIADFRVIHRAFRLTSDSSSRAV